MMPAPGAGARGVAVGLFRESAGSGDAARLAVAANRWGIDFIGISVKSRRRSAAPFGPRLL